MPKPASLAFVLNPHAGSRKSRLWRGQIERELQRAGVRGEIVETARPEDVRSALSGLFGSHEIIVAVGGDGTVHHVGQELVGTERPFGVLPNGSGNDFNRMVGMPRGVSAGLRQLLQGYTPVSQDVTQVVVREADTGREFKRWSINTTGVGFDAAVSRTKTRIPLLRGLPLYLTSSLVTLFRFPALKLTVTDARVSSTFRGLMVASGTGQYEGGGFRVFPSADVRDGLMEVCEVRLSSRLGALPVLVKAVDGRHTTEPGIRMSRTGECRVICERPAPVHADGEVITERAEEVRWSVVQKGLVVAMPDRSG